MKEFDDYMKYRWFCTSSEKLVVGGKNAMQNDELLRKIKSLNKNFVIMHTHLPGSPFSIILSPTEKVTKKDKEEVAVFTACFSQLWKSGASKVVVDSFYSSDIHKSKGMKSGTWAVLGKVENFTVSLNLVLTKQRSTLRAVPKNSVKNKKDILLKIFPGKTDKVDLLPKIIIELGEKFNQSEILSALPAGGLRIEK